MTRADEVEAAAILRRVLAVMLNAGGSADQEAGAALRQAVGSLSAYAEARLREGRVGADLATCFRAATASRATFKGMQAVVAAASVETPSGAAAKAVTGAALRLALIEQAAILSATTFRSRDEVDAVLTTVGVTFPAAAEAAADAGEDRVYRAITALHAAVVRDLSRRSRPLPRMVTYTFARGLPTLTMANRFYGDAGRADEIRAENGILHPLFAPSKVRALSA